MSALRLTEEEYSAMLGKRKQPRIRGAVKVEDPEGGKFDSKREHKAWQALCARVRAGEIQGLGRQARFLLPGGIIYVADFTYLKDGLHVVDAKGHKTDAYKLKKRLMREIGFEIEEV